MNPLTHFAALLAPHASSELEVAKRLLEEADVSHDELRRNLQAAIKATRGMPIPGCYCWIRDVFDDRVVFEEEAPTGTTLYQQSYTVSDDGTVSLEGMPTKVKATTAYVAVKEAADLSESLEALLERAFSTEQRVAMAKKGQAIPVKNADGEVVDGAYPVPDIGALKDAIQAIGRAKDPAAAKAHIRKRAAALGASNLVPKIWSEAAAGGDRVLEEGPVELTGDVVALVEKAVRKDGTIPLRLIAPGWGSSGYYSAEVLKRDGAKAFPKGTHMYWDHPTKTEETDRPERSVRDLAAVTTSAPVWKDNGQVGPGLYADAAVRKPFQADVEELAPHIGVSIRASGTRALGEAEGRKGQLITSIVTGESVDFVTKAGAGGQVVSLFEAARGRGQAGSSEPEVDNVSEQELKEARDALAAAEKARDDAIAESKRSAEQLVLREARDVVVEALAKVEMPDITRARLIEQVAKNPPTKDGSLDRDALATAITEAAKAEAAYLAKVTGSGAIQGMGPGAGQIAESEKRLEAAFGRLGLSETGAKIAAGGRSH